MKAAGAWLVMLMCVTTASAQTWSPQKNVEIVVGSAPGGSNDKTARTVERIVVQNKLIPTTLTVVNKPGGGSNIAFTYVQQHTADPHYLMVGTPSLLTNHITGLSKLHYTDYTPIASLFNDYVVFAVNASSPIKTGRELAERLKKDPKSVTIGFATTLGSHNHIAAGLLAQTNGGGGGAPEKVAVQKSSPTKAGRPPGGITIFATAAGATAAARGRG